MTKRSFDVIRGGKDMNRLGVFRTTEDGEIFEIFPEQVDLVLGTETDTLLQQLVGPDVRIVYPEAAA